MAKYLVTGAAGFIGRSIAAALLARGESVRGRGQFYNRQTREPGWPGRDGVSSWRPGRSGGLRGGLREGVEIVFHEAALASVPRSVADPVGNECALR